MNRASLEAVRSLLDAPSPAVLTTYRKDGSALVSPVWAEVAGRYMGASEGAGFAAERTKPGVLLRLRAEDPRVWDLSGILPS